MTLRFTITFHGPFQVGGTGPADGLDRRLDREDPLPATSIKGLLRAHAANATALGLPTALVAEVFGGAGRTAAPWWFSPVSFETPLRYTLTSRIRIDDTSGTTERGFLALGEAAWAEHGTFTVQPALGEPVPEGRRTLHERVLRASARCVSSLGGDRRRGMGWVTISDDLPWTDADSAALLAERAAS